MLSKIRSYLYNRKLQRLGGTNLHKTRAGHFSALKSVGCVFDASETEVYKSIEKFAKELRKSGKEVDILGFYNQKNVPDVSPFRFFTTEHLSMAMIPSKSEIATQFMTKPFDLLINFSSTPHPPVSYLCAASHALFKVGPSTANINHYDLIIDLPAGFDVDRYINELRRTLNLMI